ncbi:MAG: SPOR domain-containing protein [Gallionella sp.]
MAKSNNKKTADSKGSPLLAGLLIGLIIGLGLAAGMAWYLMKSPSPFVSKEPVVVNKTQASEQLKASASAVVKQNAPPVSAVAGASGVDDGKPRFEFYKVLTDKQDTATLPAQGNAKKLVLKPAAEVANPPAKQIYYLQAGAFANEAEAEKLKANLIIDGMEVTVLAVNTPDKGTLHKVRVGPYQGADEMNSARAKLQLKGISSTPMHGQ